MVSASLLFGAQARSEVSPVGIAIFPEHFDFKVSLIYLNPFSTNCNNKLIQ